jgi:hypothetical protein
MDVDFSDYVFELMGPAGLQSDDMEIVWTWDEVSNILIATANSLTVAKISLGAITKAGYENSVGITDQAVGQWTDYLIANNINSYAVWCGSSLDTNDRQLLDPSAFSSPSIAGDDVDGDGILDTVEAQSIDSTFILASGFDVN